MTLKFHSLSIRYLLTFSLLVLLPVLFFTFLINISYSRYQEQWTGIQMQETVNQMALSLNSEIASVSILSSALIHNIHFRTVCDNYDAAVEPSELYRRSEQLDNEFSNLFLYTNKVGVAYVYTKNKPVFLFRNFPMIKNQPDLPRQDHELQKAVEGDPGFIHISNNFFSIYQDKGHRTHPLEPLLILAVRPKDVQVGNSIEKILFAYKIKLIEQIYNNQSQQQFYFLSDQEGKILLEPRQSLPGEGLSESQQGTLSSRWLLLSAPIDSTDWILHYAIDIRAFMNPFHRIQRFSYLVMGAMFVFFIIYTVLFFQNMISPLNILIEKMQLVEKGDYSVNVPEPGQVEMNHLFHSFNSMIERVSDLTESKLRIDRERSELELQALQYQINPHFIANTLNSIRLMAVVKKNENIKNMTASLMQVINDSFRGQGNKTTLEEETAALSSYVHIMKVRFSTPIELRFSIPPELNSLPILKMLLQPLVENAVVHGFAAKTGKGIILIQVRTVGDKRVLIRVCDNGCGMVLEGNSLPKSPNTHKSGTLTKVGIQNVDRRIKLNYGDEFGLTMRSLRNSYSVIRIMLPVQKKEETVDDINHDCG